MTLPFQLCRSISSPQLSSQLDFEPERESQHESVAQQSSSATPAAEDSGKEKQEREETSEAKGTKIEQGVEKKVKAWEEDRGRAGGAGSSELQELKEEQARWADFSQKLRKLLVTSQLVWGRS